MGFLVSADAGETWRKQNPPNLKYVTSVALSGNMLVAASRNAIAVSVNGGDSWLTPKPLAPDFVINSVAVDTTGTIWLAAREGIFRSTDVGDTWNRVMSLRLSDVVSIEFDPENQRILATGATSTNVFESTDNCRTWTAINTGWRVRNVSSAHGRLLATTPFDGVVIQPEAAATERADSSAATR
jgi:photosystem II stability/assembly factor-like uncharacterized protein